MRYCVPYHKDFRYLNKVDEIILDGKYINLNDMTEKLDNFISTNGITENQRLIFDISSFGDNDKRDEYILELQKYFDDKNFHIAIMFNSFSYEKLKNVVSRVPYFFADYATTIEEVYVFIQKGVSDIYITESLAFRIKEISDYCNRKGCWPISIRVLPNVAQYDPSFKEELPRATSFFIRPEDTDLYEDYVNVFELWANGVSDKLSVFYEVYKNKQWLGDLRDLIVGLNENFPNSIPPVFGASRVNCGHKCMLGKCTVCQECQTIATQFKNANLEVKRKRDQNWKEE